MLTTSNDAIAMGIQHASRVLMHFTEDLKGDDWLHRPCAGGNCAAWIVGHLVLTARSMMTKCGVSDLPPIPADFEKRFARDDTAPKSAEFGDLSSIREVFQRHHEMFAEVARKLPAEKMSEVMRAGHPFFDTLGSALVFMPVHIASHAGHISTIRRSLGRPPLV